MTDYGIYNPTIKERIMLAILLAVALETIGLLFYNNIWGIAILPVAYFFLDKKYRAMMVKKRRDKLRNQFRDVLYSLSSTFATGEHMLSAMEKSVVSIGEIHGNDSDMQRELEEMIIKIRGAGEDEIELWKDFGLRSGVEDIRDFAEVFANCRDAGGNLVKTVDRATEILSEKIGIESDIKLMASQKVTEGRIVGMMPVFMIAFLRLTSPAYMNVMYESIMGRVVMTVSAAITIAAFIVTERVTRIEV